MTAEVCVVVASHERPLRLRWLLNALEGQVLASDRWELVVVDDSVGPGPRELLRTHPLARAGRLRALELPVGTGTPGRQRNAGWRVARAGLVVFTDDDCRPPAEWLARLLAAAARHPGAVVQGATRPDPDEAHLAREPYARTQSIDPPGPWAQTCNIAYPRVLLERLNGFDERLDAGEDAELAQRAIRAGASYVGAPQALTYHAVDPGTLAGRLRSLPRWRHLAYLVKRHPSVRRHFTMGVFWKPTHAWLLLAAAGTLASHRRLALLLVLPWARAGLPPRELRSTSSPLRALGRIPGRAAIDVTEIAVLVWGSARYRTLLL